MTDKEIELAAKIVKIVSLASNPMMDEVAVKLNAGPTYNEIRKARYWAKAFELAERGGDAFELAAELNAEINR
jgi:hypothetical protein